MLLFVSKWILDSKYVKEGESNAPCDLQHPLTERGESGITVHCRARACSTCSVLMTGESLCPPEPSYDNACKYLTRQLSPAPGPSLVTAKEAAKDLTQMRIRGGFRDNYKTRLDKL